MKGQERAIPISGHTYEPKTAVVAINYGRMAGSLEARRVQGGVIVFHRDGKVEKILYRLIINGEFAINRTKRCPLRKREDAVLTAYITADDRLIIELLQVAVLAEIRALPSGISFEVALSFGRLQ